MFLLIVVPAVAAIVIAIASLHAAIRHGASSQALLAFPTVGLSAVALLTLWAMFKGAWPTYLPYLAIALALLLLFVQLLAGWHRHH